MVKNHRYQEYRPQKTLKEESCKLLPNKNTEEKNKNINKIGIL